MRLRLKERHRRLGFLRRHVAAAHHLTELGLAGAVLGRVAEVVEEPLALVADALPAQRQVDVVHQRVGDGVGEERGGVNGLVRVDAGGAHRVENLVAERGGHGRQRVLAGLELLLHGVEHGGVDSAVDVGVLRRLPAFLHRSAQTAALFERLLGGAKTGVDLRSTSGHGGLHPDALGHRLADRPRVLHGLWRRRERADGGVLGVGEEVERGVDGEEGLVQRRALLLGEATALRDLQHARPLVVGEHGVREHATECGALVGAERVVGRHAQRGGVDDTAGQHEVHACLVGEERTTDDLLGLGRTERSSRGRGSLLKGNSTRRHGELGERATGHERTGDRGERELRLEERLGRDAHEVESLTDTARSHVDAAVGVDVRERRRRQQTTEGLACRSAGLLARLLIRLQRVVEALRADADRGLHRAQKALRRAVENLKNVLIAAVVRRVQRGTDLLKAVDVVEEVRRILRELLAEERDVRSRRLRRRGELVDGEVVEERRRFLVARRGLETADALQGRVADTALDGVALVLRLFGREQPGLLAQVRARTLHAERGREGVEAVVDLLRRGDVADELPNGGCGLLREVRGELLQRHARGDHALGRATLGDAAPLLLGGLRLRARKRHDARHGERKRTERRAHRRGLRRVRRHLQVALRALVIAEEHPLLFLLQGALVELLLRHPRRLLAHRLLELLRRLLDLADVLVGESGGVLLPGAAARLAGDLTRQRSCRPFCSDLRRHRGENRRRRGGRRLDAEALVQPCEEGVLLGRRLRGFDLGRLFCLRRNRCYRSRLGERGRHRRFSGASSLRRRALCRPSRLARSRSRRGQRNVEEGRLGHGADRITGSWAKPPSTLGSLPGFRVASVEARSRAAPRRQDEGKDSRPRKRLRVRRWSRAPRTRPP